MKRSGSEPPGEQPHRRESIRSTRRLETIGDPDALAILIGVARDPATSAEVAERLGLEIGGVRRHLRRLSHRGQVAVGARVRRRGRLENLYLADPRATVLDPADLADLPRDSVAAAELALARAMFREAAAATNSGIFGRRVDSSLVRALVPVDERGLSRAVEIHRVVLDEILREAGEARARIDGAGGKSISTSVQVLCFEHPIARWALPPGRATVRRRRGADLAERSLEQAADPLRRSILEFLSVMTATAVSLAELLEAPPETVRYELDRLVAEGAVRIAGKNPSRGTVERVFETNLRRTTLSVNDLETSNATPSGDWANSVVRMLFGAALTAIGEGEGAETKGLFLARSSASVDAQGFHRIENLAHAAVEELADLRAGTLEARAEGELPARVVVSGLLAFEQVS